MNAGLARRIAITLAIFATPLIVGLLLTYQVIHVDWISFMEIQPSFRPMEAPMPLPAMSVPLEGAAYLPGVGSPINPSQPGPDTTSRGKALYAIHCALCHGESGKGDGPVAADLERKPSDLTAVNATSLSDGEIFLVITNGLQVGAARKGGMPSLRENLNVADRWNVVNYLRTLQQGGAAAPSYVRGKCAVRALDLIGAWVAAKTPKDGAFPFSDVHGGACQGTFAADVLPLFTQANLWYAGAPSCRTCHGSDVQISYARLSLSDFEGILAGSGRSSAQEKGEDILGGGDWEKSTLYDVLHSGDMPPNRPVEVNPGGPILSAGTPQ
jgi:mono/diheme cytochrome c family protein